MSELEDFIAKTDALIAETSAFIQEARLQLVQAEQQLQSRGIDVDALKAQARAELTSVAMQPLDCTISAEPGPLTGADWISKRRRMLRALI